MKIYISGKITGLEIADAEKKFADAAEKVAQISSEHVPVNPMAINLISPEKTWKDYMRADIDALFDCDAILMLPCWIDSKGAKLEHIIADALGLKIFYGEVK